MKCQISHFVRYIDETQTQKFYDYFWCTVHQRVAKNNDFCLDVEKQDLKNGTRIIDDSQGENNAQYNTK